MEAGDVKHSAPCLAGRKEARALLKCLGSRARTVSQRGLPGGESAVLSTSDMFYFNHHPTQRLLVASFTALWCLLALLQQHALSQKHVGVFQPWDLLLPFLFFFGLCRFVIFLFLYYHFSEVSRGRRAKPRWTVCQDYKLNLKAILDTATWQKIQGKKGGGNLLSLTRTKPCYNSGVLFMWFFAMHVFRLRSSSWFA